MRLLVTLMVALTILCVGLGLKIYLDTDTISQLRDDIQRNTVCNEDSHLKNIGKMEDALKAEEEALSRCDQKVVEYDTVISQSIQKIKFCDTQISQCVKQIGDHEDSFTNYMSTARETLDDCQSQRDSCQRDLRISTQDLEECKTILKQ